MKRVYFAFLLSLWIGNDLVAQEQRVFSQFFMNPYVYNPAYVGVDGHIAVFALYRAQWVGINGAPTFSHINFHTPLKGGIAVGVLAFNDTESQITTSGIKGTIGYLLAVDKKHYVRFGLSIGAGRSGYDLSQIDVTLDPAFQNLSSSSFMIADFGVSYHFGHFNVGFAIPNLISREIVTQDAFSTIKFSPTDNMLFKVNVRGHISDDFAVEPHIIYRFSTVNLPQYEAAVIFHIKHIVWVGAGFRQDAGIIGLAGIKIKEKIGVGYSYELGNSALSSFSSGTHEIHIGIHFGDRKKHHDHSHSFIKSHRLTAEERAAEAAKKSLAEDTRRKSAEERAAAATAAREAARLKAAEDKAAEDKAAEEKQRVDETPDETKETIEQKQTDTFDRPEEIEEIKPIETPKETTPVIVRTSSNVVKRGTHFLELPVGHHVIAGAFTDFQRAEDYSDRLFERGFHDTIVGYSSAKQYYYVVIYHATDFNRTESEKNRVKKVSGLEDVWVLTVEQ